jgi:hypothetical protein
MAKMLLASSGRTNFAPLAARFVRFTVTASSPEACLDELEVFDQAGRNVALGAKVAVIEGKDRIAGLHLIPDLHVDLGDRAGSRRA